jgi:hypothetical protein
MSSQVDVDTQSGGVAESWVNDPTSLAQPRPTNSDHASTTANTGELFSVLKRETELIQFIQPELCRAGA